jgi:4-diphosphocytidyl-2-C-methyl-D-erythritol kinase
MSEHTLTVRAAAKINLHLGVGAPREDGFHPLDTVYQAVSLHDDLTVSSAPQVRLGMRMADHVDRAAVPDGGDNLITRAVALLAGHHGRDLPVDLLLDKSIPVAGGMAGGSADAAAALVAVDRWHDLHTSDDDLLALAAELGSDVPFSLVGGTARGTGRGEVVQPLSDPGSWWWVVVPSREGLSTPAVYRRFDELHPDAPAAPAAAEPLVSALATGEPLRLARVLHNDLEEPAIDLRPELGVLIDRGVAAGALRGLVSGSGPTVVFLAEGRLGADALAHELAAHHDVVLVAHGPVAGAHVVGPRTHL